MKRKFHISLGHLRMPSRADTRALEASINSKYSPPTSPFIERRRPLTPTTEADLKAACAAVARNYKPSDSELQEQKAAEAKAEQLARAEKEEAARRAYHSKYVNSRFDAFPRAAPHPANTSRYSYRPNAALKEVLAESGHARPRQNGYVNRHAELRHFNSTYAMHPMRSYSLLPPAMITTGQSNLSDEPAPAPAPAPNKDSSDSSSSSPRSGSTDNRLGQRSTNVTSAVLTQPSSRHPSSNQLHPLQPAPKYTDVQAVSRMKQETERHKSQLELRQQQPTDQFETMDRSNSRGKGIRNEIRDYIRPKSTTGGRPSSDGQDSTASRLSGTNQPWKSWGLQKRMSASPLSFRRSTASLVDPVSPERRGREVDLNRELPPLPPLPRLDQWPEEEEIAANGLHIAELMRKDNRDYWTKKQARFSESTPNLARKDPGRVDSVAVARTVSIRSFQGARTASRRSTHDDVPRTSMSNVDLTTPPRDARRSTSFTSPQKNTNPHHAVTSPLGTSSVAAARHRRHLTSSSTGSAAPNFSRKYSSEQARPRSNPFSPNQAGMTALPSVPPPTPATDKKGSRLRRMFSTIGRPRVAGRPRTTESKAEGDWMTRIESNGGVRSGLLVIDEAADAPVIRY